MKLADSGAGVATVVVGLLTIFAVAVAVDGYVEWSSDAALAEFMSAANVSASDTNNLLLQLRISLTRGQRDVL